MSTVKIPNYLEVVFNENYSCTENEMEYRFYQVTIGYLNVVHGKIIACDPFLFNHDKPFTDTFPTGQVPIQLSIAKISNDERVGFSRLKFLDSIPIKWRLAITEDQNISTLKGDYFFGYPVDSGTGGFMDTSSAQVYLNFLMEADNNFQKVIDLMEKTYKDTRSWLLWLKDNFNVALFSSGWGDGLYPTFIGLDSNDNICRLVTDFLLIDQPE